MKTAILGMMFCALLIVGCGHEIDLQVTNATEKTLPVSVSGQGVGARNIGKVPGYGTLDWSYTYDDDILPTMLTVKVGEQTQSLNITESVETYRVDVTVYGEIRQRGEGEVEDEKQVETETPLGPPVEVIE